MSTTEDRRPPVPPRRGVDVPPLVRRIRESVVGAGRVVPGPYGPRPLTYADWTASGRCLGFLEDLVRDEVLPLYANTHTESSTTGRRTSRLREDARSAVHRSLGGDDDTVVVFCGSGATGAVDRLVGILGLRSAGADGGAATVPAAERPVVLVGPYEHHSNELPWRESVAQVVAVPADRYGMVDLAALEVELRRHADRPLLVGSFSAASNVTGVLSDVRAVSSLLHAYGALACWDYAAAGPYVPISVRAPDDDPSAWLDAVFLSPHKLVGGPGAPGVLAVRRQLMTNPVPVVPGGGTVSFVSATRHRYLDDPVQREEGGTPSIIGAVRAGLAFQLKDAVGADVVTACEDDLLRRALDRWRDVPQLELLGPTDAPRLPILSFRVRAPSGRYLHHAYVVALLDDLLGVQCRGGCSCAGPYGHLLLGVDEETSARVHDQVALGLDGIKPGWVRVSLSYAMTPAEVEHVLDAVVLVAREGWRLLPDYRFDAWSGLWRHRSAPDDGLRLDQVGYDGDGVLRYPPQDVLPGADPDLARCLDRARCVLAARAPAPDPPQAVVSRDFESLRWFDLPAVCLAPTLAAEGAGPAVVPLQVEDPKGRHGADAATSRVGAAHVGDVRAGGRPGR